MKRRQFNIYVAQVCDVFGVSKYDIFTKTKREVWLTHGRCYTTYVRIDQCQLFISKSL